MAYNPFNIFRRNQKVIFAIVTVFIMFTFVLSSGLGGGADFFDWLPGWISSKSRKGDVLATIDGTKIYDRDLSDARRNRVMANRFMNMAAGQSIGNLRSYVREQAGRVSPEHRQGIQQAAGLLNMLEDPQMARMALQFGGSMLGQAEAITQNPTAKEEDKQVARAILMAFNLAQRQMSGGGEYFANAPNRTTRDTIDFILWDRKAKQLGIDFSTEDVKLLIQKEFLNQFKSDVEIRKVLEKEMPGVFNLEACMNAIAAEFRVRAAQTTLFGPVGGRSDRTLSAAPTFSAPYDVFQTYRDKSSPTDYQVLAVPGAAFASTATGTPTEDELKRLYDQYKDDEPNPAKENPGFKEPRKIKLEWVEVTGKEPYYQKMAQEEVNQRPMAAAAVLPGLGGWNAVLAVPFAASDPVMRQQYENEVVSRHRQALLTDWSGFSTSVTPMYVLDASVVRARNLAALTGGTAGSLGAFGNPFLPSMLLSGGVIAAEQKDRAVIGVPLFLGTIPGPDLFATTIGSAARAGNAFPMPIAFEVYRPELIKSLLEKKARELAINDLRKLREEVNKLSKDGKEKNPKPAMEYIADFVKTRGLKTGGSKGLESEWTIGDDAGLEPLKAVATKSPHGNVPVQFGKKFFWTDGSPQMGVGPGPVTGTFKPDFYPAEPRTETPQFGLPEKPEPIFLTWRTEEQAAKGVPFQSAKTKVADAWKRIKGREQAKATAEALAAEIRAKAFTSPFQINGYLVDKQKEFQARFPDPKERDKVRLFAMPDVAPVQLSVNPSAMGMGGPRPFQLAPSNDILYPTQDMAKALLDERTKPVNTVLVLADQPKDTYYVAVLADRREKSAEQFRIDVYTAPPGGGGGMMGGGPTARDAIFRLNQAESGKRAYESVLELVKKELNYVETDAQKKLIEKKSDDKGGGSDEF